MRQLMILWKKKTEQFMLAGCSFCDKMMSDLCEQVVGFVNKVLGQK